MKHLVVWITGLSAAGKSTLAKNLAQRHAGRCIDADKERQRWPQVGFTTSDRLQSMVRLAARARRFQQHAGIVVVAAISPTHADRRCALLRLRPSRWLLIHLATPLSVCEQRDPHQLYRRARNGQLVHMCGVDVAYEIPRGAAVVHIPGLSRLAVLAQAQQAIRRAMRRFSTQQERISPDAQALI